LRNFVKFVFTNLSILKHAAGTTSKKLEENAVSSTRRIAQKGEASPALVPAEQSLPTYTLFASYDNPPNILGVRHVLQNLQNIKNNRIALQNVRGKRKRRTSAEAAVFYI